MANHPLRVGIIGCGVIGKAHARAAAADGIKLVAVADISESAAQAVAEEFAVPRIHTSVEAMLADDQVDMVVLALVTEVRRGMGLKAVKAGKHVLLEKPPGMDVEELLDLKAAAESAGWVVACCSSRASELGSALAAREVVASGVLGALRVLRVRAVAAAGKPPVKPPPPWRVSRAMNGGGYLVNWGVYDIDYLMNLTGWSLVPRVVLAQTWKVPSQYVSRVAEGSDAETYYAATIRCAGGEMILMERGEFIPVMTDQAWQIIGEHGSLRLHMPAEKKVLYHDDSTPDGVVSREIWQGEETWADAHAFPLRDLAAAIRDHRPPATNIDKAIVIQKIIDAIYESARIGRAVEID